MHALDLKDLAKYPFLKEAQLFIANQASSLEEYLESPTGRLSIKEALDTITNAIRFNPSQVPADNMEVPSESSAIRIIIASYPVSRLLISCIGDRMLIDRVCRYQSWRIYRYLQEEEPGKKEIISSSLGFSGNLMKIPVIQYIEIAARMTEQRWRLVNRAVDKGIVPVHPDEIDEILRERLRVIMIQNLPLKVPPAICIKLKPAHEHIEAVLQARMLEEFGTVEESAFPPCIQSIIHALIHRTHLTHMGRFAVTAFLHNIGMENSRIVEMYGHVPDFDISKTMYQVDHISGQGGGGTEYKCPLCSTMRTHSLCIHPDALCNKITHPLTYYKQKKRMISGSKKKETGNTYSSVTDVPNQVPATADNSNKEKQRDQISSSTSNESRDDQKSGKKDTQT